MRNLKYELFPDLKKEKEKKNENAFLTFINNLLSIEKYFYEIKCTFFFSLEKILTPLKSNISGQKRTKMKLRHFKHIKYRKVKCDIWFLHLQEVILLFVGFWN